MSEKFAKFKSAKSNAGSNIQDQFENVLNEVTSASILPIPSTLTRGDTKINNIYYDLEVVLNELSAEPENDLFTSKILNDLIYIISSTNANALTATASQESVRVWLSTQSQSLQTKIRESFGSAEQSRGKKTGLAQLRDF